MGRCRLARTQAHKEREKKLSLKLALGHCATIGAAECKSNLVNRAAKKNTMSFPRGERKFTSGAVVALLVIAFIYFATDVNTSILLLPTMCVFAVAICAYMFVFLRMS